MEIVKSAPCAVGLMKIENLFRYTALAVGLKPPASQGEARLRGLWRIIYSKTITQCAPAMALRWLAAASEAVVSHPV